MTIRCGEIQRGAHPVSKHVYGSVGGGGLYCWQELQPTSLNAWVEGGCINLIEIGK
jgi:hypothetical protein